MSTSGMFSTSEGIVIHVGDIMSTSGVVQYIGGIMIYVGEYHEYHRGCSVHWRDTMNSSGHIMIHV